MKVKFNKTWLGCIEGDIHATTFTPDEIYEVGKTITERLASVAVSVGAAEYLKPEPIKRSFFKSSIENKVVEPEENKKDPLPGFVESISTMPTNTITPVVKKKRKSRKKVK